MQRHAFSVAACFSAALVIAGASGVSAQGAAAKDKVKVDFSTPVMVPGMTLPAGTYVFRLADHKTNRHIVQVWNADESKMLTVALAIPARRADPKGDIVVRFSGTPSPKLPPALKAYFYPGDVTGHEFIYGEEEARRISDETKTAVLSHDIKSGKLEGWESATIRIWDQGKAKPYTEPRGTAGQP